MEIKQYIKENEARFMEELFSLIRIPSISALPEHKDDMLACALRLKELLLTAGADEAMVMPSQGNPLVFAQKHVSNDAPTLLIYAHYDVMPASSFVIAQVREWRKCIGEYDIFRTLYAKVVWVGEKVLAGVPTVKKDA